MSASVYFNVAGEKHSHADWSHFKFIIMNLKKVSAAWQSWYIFWPMLCFIPSVLQSCTQPHNFNFQKIEIIRENVHKLSSPYPPNLLPLTVVLYMFYLVSKSTSLSIIMNVVPEVLPLPQCSMFFFIKTKQKFPSINKYALIYSGFKKKKKSSPDFACPSSSYSLSSLPFTVKLLERAVCVYFL